MTFSLDQRLYNLKISKKDLHEECKNRGRKVSYSTICKAINEPGTVLYSVEKKIVDTIQELEKEKGIVSIEF